MQQGLFTNSLSYYSTIIEWLESNMLPCYFKYFFGIDCPGCGLQRSIILLLEGNIWDSVMMYPALLPILFVLLLHFTNKKISYNGQAIFFKITVWVVASIIAVNFLYKIILRLV